MAKIRLFLASPARTVEVDPSTDAAGLADALQRAIRFPMAGLRLLHRGRTLLGPCTLAEVGVHDGDVIHALPRLRGGGGDGGVYPPTAHELKWMNDIGGGTKRSSWAVLGGSVSRTQFERVSSSLRRFESCSTCALTGEPLCAPVVCCELGMLYNKAPLIEALLDKASRPLDARFAHVRSLKDMTAVTLHPDSDGAAQHGGQEPMRAATAADSSEDGLLGRAPFQCPVTKLPFNGRHQFYAVRPTGHVVSERALAMMGWELCPVTERKLAPPAALTAEERAEEGGSAKKRISPDLIPLALSDDELEAARQRLASQRAAAVGGKKRSAKQAALPTHGAGDGAGGGSSGGKLPRVTEAAGCGAGSGAQPAAGRSTAHAGGASGSLLGKSVIQAAQDEIARKAQSGVFSGLFLPQARKEEEARQIREGKDYMTRAIQPGKPKER